jgi:methionyl-tRNA synthetase
MLMSAGLPVPTRVFAHGFLTKDGRKMGKTLGNTLDPVDLVERYGADAIRYYFLKEIEFGKDGDFSESRFIDIVNADLANVLGNLLNRTHKMVQKYCDARVPDVRGEDIPADNPLKEIGLELSVRVAQAYEALAFSEACRDIFTLLRASNKFIDDSAPWSLYKQGNLSAVEQVLYTVLESVRLAAYLLSPIIPSISTDIYQQLGFSTDFNEKNLINDSAIYATHASWGALRSHQSLGQPKPIFLRLEQA